MNKSQQNLLEKQIEIDNNKKQYKKPYNKLLMVSSQQYRQKVEEADTLETLKTPMEKYGQKTWYTQLRCSKSPENSNFKQETYMPDILQQGLYTKSVFVKPEVQIIRKPYTASSSNRHKTDQLSAYNSSMFSSNHAKFKIQQYSNTIQDQVILPDECQHLEDFYLQGQSIYEMEIKQLDDGRNVHSQYKKVRIAEESIREKRKLQIKKDFNTHTFRSEKEQKQLKEQLDWVQNHYQTKETQSQTIVENYDKYQSGRTGEYIQNEIQKKLEIENQKIINPNQSQEPRYYAIKTQQ